MRNTRHYGYTKLESITLEPGTKTTAEDVQLSMFSISTDSSSWKLCLYDVTASGKVHVMMNNYNLVRANARTIYVSSALTHCVNVLIN